MVPSAIPPDETSSLLGSSSSECTPTPAPIPDASVDLEYEGGVEDNRDSTENSFEALDKRPNILVIFPVITIGTFLSAADGTIALVSYVTISSELGALNMASWIITAYALSLVSSQPLYGKLCDIFGRKQCLLVAYALFAVGCLACGIAQSMGQIITARVIQAIGGAGMGTVVSILLTGLVPIQDRGLWQGVLNIVYSLGAGLGAPLGGLLAGSVGWRWSFFGQVPICVIAMIVVSCCLAEDVGQEKETRLEQQELLQQPSDQETLLAKLSRVDFLGTGSLVVAIVAFMLGVDRGSSISWVTLETLVSFLISAMATICFLYVENCVAREPIVPPSVFLSPGLLPIYLSSFLSFFALAALEFILPLYYQVRDNLTPQDASLYMIPAIIAGVCGAMTAGLWMRHTGQYYWAMMLGFTIQVVGTLIAFLFSGPVCEYTPCMVLGHVMNELGLGIYVVAALIAAITNACDNSVAVVTASYYAFRSLGYVLGISVVSTVVQQYLRSILHVKLQSYDIDVDAVVDEVTRSIESLQTLNPEISAIVRDCYGKAMNKGFLVVFVIAVIGAISALRIRGGKTRRK